MPHTKYLWDPLSDNVLMEKDENGDTKATNTYLPELYGDMISQRRDGETSYYHFDGQGSARALTDENEDVTDTYTYTGFGEHVSGTGATENPYRYVGEKGYYFDEETDDYYIRARNYEPTIARWLSADPLGQFREFLIAIQLTSAYSYSDSSPISKIDPAGLWTDQGNHIYMASLDDTFEDLVRLVAPQLTANNTACIRPVPPADQLLRGWMEEEWERKRPIPCGRYDVRNLVDALPRGREITAGIGTDSNNYIGAASTFYGATRMRSDQLERLIMNNAARGRTPIGSLIIIGHGQRNAREIGGMGRNPDTFGLKIGPVIYAWPRFPDAVAGNLPPLCWFRTDAVVRLVGCNTSNFARSMAAGLRGGAVAIGTLTYTWGGSREMGWGRLSRRNIVRDVGAGSARTTDDYHNRFPDKWKSWQGTN